MSITKLFTLSCLLVFTSLLRAQDGYQQILPAGNDVTTASGLDVTWSLGDVFADDFTGAPLVLISRVDERLARAHGLRLIGNPTPDFTRLEVTHPLDLSYRVYDLQGRLLVEQDAGRANRYEVDLRRFPPQIYLLSIFTTDANRPLATYRVRKF